MKHRQSYCQAEFLLEMIQCFTLMTSTCLATIFKLMNRISIGEPSPLTCLTLVTSCRNGPWCKRRACLPEHAHAHTHIHTQVLVFLFYSVGKPGIQLVLSRTVRLQLLLSRRPQSHIVSNTLATSIRRQSNSLKHDAVL
jgi:hypothetical protein